MNIAWVVLSSDEERAKEARQSAVEFLHGAREKSIEILEFRNSFFPYFGREIKEYFEELKGRFQPDLILTHHRYDLHQDHKVISDLTWNTFRDHLILEYEIPKYDGDMGSPNVFVHLEHATRQEKIGIIMRSFPSQQKREWFTEDLFHAMMRLRGMESNSPSGLAEGFYCRKAHLVF